MSYKVTGQPSDNTAPRSAPIRAEFAMIGKDAATLPVRRRANNRIVVVSADGQRMETLSPLQARRLINQRTYVAFKPEDENRPYVDSTYVADDDLVLTLEGGATYAIALFGAAQDAASEFYSLRYNFTVSGTGTIKPTSSFALSMPAGTSPEFGGTTAFLDATTDVVLGIEWRGSTAGSDITLKKGAYLIARETS